MAEIAKFQSYPYLDHVVAAFNEANVQAQSSDSEMATHIFWHTYENEDRADGSCLFFYGDHIHDVQHPQLAEMRAQLDTWDREMAGRERWMRVEGRVPEPLPDATEESCMASDRGVAAWLALQARTRKIVVRSLECPASLQAADLQKPEFGGCSREALFYYYVTRQLPQGLLSLGLTQVTPEQYVWALERMQTYLLETIDRFSSELGWPDFEFSFNKLLHIHETFYPGRQFNTINRAFFEAETARNMYRPATPMQYVSNAANLHRDRYAIQLLNDDMASGVQVFAFMGGLHARNAQGLGSRYLRV